jgi:hypothetical protein
MGLQRGRDRQTQEAGSHPKRTPYDRSVARLVFRAVALSSKAHPG